MKKAIAPLFLLSILFTFALMGYSSFHDRSVGEMISMLFGGDDPAEEKMAEKKPVPKKKKKTNLQARKSKPIRSEATNVKPAFVAESYQPLPGNRFYKIDRHARKSNSAQEASISSLAAYLSEPASTDLEKTRAIYIWLTKHISYNDTGYNSGDYGDNSAVGVLQSRRAVCEGYSNLFLALGEEMGLVVKKIKGYSKGYSYYPGKPMTETDHAWNQVRIDGEWRIFDATWGEGYGTTVNGKLKSVKEYEEYWFNVDPYEAIFNHYPENAGDAHVKPLPSLDRYSKMPYAPGRYFALGFSGKEALEIAKKHPEVEFPKAYGADTHIEVRKAPRHEKLTPGKPYSFEIFVPRGKRVALIDAEHEFHYLEVSKGVFVGKFKPGVAGELNVGIEHEKDLGLFHTILTYEVK